MKIDKQKLIDDLKDTQNNDFESIVCDLFEKYSVVAEVLDNDKNVFNADLMFDDQFLNACKEFLELVCNFIENTKE